MEHQIQEINCPICMMIFKRPITISCGHTFCHSCLNNSLRDHKNCPICRHHVASMSAKIKVDEHIQLVVDHFKRTINKIDPQPKKGNIYMQCKAERLLLIDVITDDLLLPFNKITSTFELQSNALLDRMERFVARQELPFNRYSIVCKLVRFEEIRKNLYKGVLEGCAFCTIESEEVESELSLEVDDEEYFYRTCKSKEISETTDTNPAEFDSFFTHFDKIEEECLKKLIFSRIDPNVFTQRNDPIAIFYSIIGIVSLNNDSKYKIATTFDEEMRLTFIKEYLSQNEKKIKSKPSSLVQIPIESSVGDKKFFLLILLLVCVYLFAQSQDL